MFIVLIRTIILYFLVVLVIRLMGKRQIGQLQPYEFVITIMISDLAALPMQDTRLPLILGIIPIITLLMVKTILSEIQLKSTIARKIIDGTPSILIKEGRINFSALNTQRVNIDDLMEELRLNGYFNIDEIQYAILENNGQISIIPKKKVSPVTKEDLGVKVKEETLPIVLLHNGKVNKKALITLNKNEEWFFSQLKEHHIKNQEDLLIAMLDSNGKFFYQTKKSLQDFGDENL
ncbi:DUF421 domain-containing protein [Clostridium polyendosporum]|uniref:DUF421 domain-containing protein n=1 Tax=Clostridium polyendosporum TaxID=69208 RepID=A0A919RZP0_9CLOT|nr:DUF421 domain-containing protein [Clostridium polyendosporum]GIM29427.1 DUF421 domain-containing protein [Clostridium polyendosporum]